MRPIGPCYPRYKRCQIASRLTVATAKVSLGLTSKLFRQIAGFDASDWFFLFCFHDSQPDTITCPRGAGGTINAEGWNLTMDLHHPGLSVSSKWLQQLVQASRLCLKDVPSSLGRLELRVCSRTSGFLLSPCLPLWVVLSMAVSFGFFEDQNEY